MESMSRKWYVIVFLCREQIDKVKQIQLNLKSLVFYNDKRRSYLCAYFVFHNKRPALSLMSIIQLIISKSEKLGLPFLKKLGSSVLQAFLTNIILTVSVELFMIVFTYQTRRLGLLCKPSANL